MTVVETVATVDRESELRRMFGVGLPILDTVEDEREHREQMLVAAFHILTAMDMEEGVAGHVTARDPEHHDRFWVNPWS